MNYNLLKLKLIRKYPQLQRFLKVNYGIDLSLSDEETKESHYIFGVSSILPKKIIKPDANWLVEAETLEKEKQSGMFIESMNCTVYSFLNAVEIILSHKYNEKINFSDRWLGIKAGTTRNGNLPIKIIDTARKQGLLLQELLPNNENKFKWNDYYSFKDAAMTALELDKEAMKWFEVYEPIGYEIVYPSVLAMAEALKYSPLYVAGFAWSFDGRAYYSAGDPNHAFVIVNIQQAIAYKTALDSYEPFIKTLGADFQVFWPKIIIINKKGEIFNTTKIKEITKKGAQWIFRADAHGELYKIENNNLVYKTNQQFTNEQILKMVEDKKLLPVNEEYFNNLLK